MIVIHRRSSYVFPVQSRQEGEKGTLAVTGREFHEPGLLQGESLGSDGPQSIKELDQSIKTRAQRGINLLTKGAQVLQSNGIHAPPYARVRLSCPPSFASSLLLEKWQA